ncbi:hypothetical protein ACHAXR_011593 [Thalassiosira sp. AJA248-18]
MAGGDAAPLDNGNAEGKLDELLSLVLARSRGEVGNEAVENALSSIVAEHAPPPPDSKARDALTSDSAAQTKKDNIIPDDGNYDDDSEDDIPAEANTSKVAATKQPEDTKATKKRKKKDKREREEAVEKIPLGKMGTRMLITFGDGPVPELEVISATLMGTRVSLQRAILDARALRRQLKDKWHQARAAATMYRTSTSNEQIKKTSTKVHGSVADNELSFKAMDGFGDNLRQDVPCGFDVPQLEILFPEEMGAYQRWKKMHDAYSENSKEIPKNSAEYVTNAKEDDGAETEIDTPGEEKVNSGRLIERLANFDARTNEMPGDWYMRFTDVRRGSFLPRSGTFKKVDGVDKQQKKRGRPPKNRSTWHTLHPSSVIFLHWIGFNHRSALSPPNEETTQALGFLAYDFFGKIVEKAVCLRLESLNKASKQDLSRSDRPLLELTGGDQLEKANIDRAVAEVDLKSLYSSSNIDLGNSANIAQLYFGPGFEDRLELEMDEMFGSKKTLTQEEMKTRKEEESLFSELPHVPALLSSVKDLLGENNEDAEKGSAASTTKKSRTE